MIIKCPKCQGITEIIDSRKSPEPALVRRRRSCRSCGERFTTIEVSVDVWDQMLKIIDIAKKNGIVP